MNVCSIYTLFCWRKVRKLVFYYKQESFLCLSGFSYTEAATGGVLYKKLFLEISQNSQENTCARVSFLIKMFSCEFCEISKSTFFTEHLWMTASGYTSTQALLVHKQQSSTELILTNNPCSFQNSFVIKTGLLSFHENSSSRESIFQKVKTQIYNL